MIFNLKSEYSIFISLSIFINFSLYSQYSVNKTDINIKIENTTFDTYHGIKIEDAYRNLENLEDSSVINWLHKQEKLAKSILHHIPRRDKIINLQKQLADPEKADIQNLKITNSGQLFYLKRMFGEEYYKLYYKKFLEAKEELLYNPERFLQETKQNYYINYVKPSWDGKKLVLGFSKNGEEFSKIRIIDVRTRKFLPVQIDKCLPNTVGIYWLPDDSGITYLRISNNKKSKSYLNTEAVIHKFDSPPRVIFSNSNNPEINMQPADFPAAFIDSQNTKYIFGVVTGATPYEDVYYLPLKEIDKDKQGWKPLYKKSDQIVLFFQDKDSLVYITSKNASNFKICKTSIIRPDLEKPITLVEEKKDEVINSFRLVKEGIVYTTTKHGVEAKLYLITHKGKHKEIPLPFNVGSLELRAKSKEHSYFEIRAEGWLRKEQRYIYDFKKQKFIEANITKQKNITILKDIKIEEILVTSHDGAEVPLSLIYNKNLKRNNNNLVFLIGYGAYGIPLKPSYSEKILSWVLEGGVFAVAHVRGGGEKGDAWYKGGFKKTKPNTWKDLIACTEYLISNKYTSSKKVTIHGSSAGGIAVGRAMTERPDLFGAVITSVGVMNTVRAETGLNGENNIKEYGTVKNPEEFKWLLEMDSYHHIKKGEKYPATLVITAMNDTRVPPWHSAKFVAKLIEYTSSKNLVLLDIDFNSGHNSTTNSRTKRVNNVADVLSFAFWKTGHPDYQPKK